MNYNKWLLESGLNVLIVDELLKSFKENEPSDLISFDRIEDIYKENLESGLIKDFFYLGQTDGAVIVLDRLLNQDRSIYYLPFGLFYGGGVSCEILRKLSVKVADSPMSFVTLSAGKEFPISHWDALDLLSPEEAEGISLLLGSLKSKEVLNHNKVAYDPDDPFGE